MNLKALFLAVALSLPFAAAATTVSSVASAEPLPAAQAGKTGPQDHGVEKGKRGEHAKGEHRKGEHGKGHHGKGNHRRGEHRKGEGAKGREHGPRGNGQGRPQHGAAKR
jgi:hypothetical protein